jgi:hypothetical protein
MADRKITALTELTAAIADDLLLVVDESEAANTANRNKKLKISSLLRAIEAGTAATPTLSFAGTSTGFYGVDSSAIGLSHNGTQTASLSYTTAGSVVQPRYSIGLATSGMSGTTDAPLHIRQVATDDAEAALVCETDDVASNQGTVIELRRKNSPSANDEVGAIKFVGDNGASPRESIQYARIKGSIVDQTDSEEDGRLEFLTQHGTAGLQAAMFIQNKKVGIGNIPVGGTLVPDVELHVKSDNAGSQVEIECTEVSAASGADLVLYRHRNGAAGVANDVLSTIKFRGKEALAALTPNDENYAFIRASIVDPNLLLPEGKLELIVDPDRGNPTTISLVTDLISFSSPIALDNGSAPAARTSPGTKGEIRWDSSYLYLCTSTGTSSAVARWTRIALDSNW